MRRFSQKDKLRIVHEYLKYDVGVSALCHKYNIGSHTLVSNWIKYYQAFGPQGLMVHKRIKLYPRKYKLKVLNWRHSHCESCLNTALHFRIYNPATIYFWERKLEAWGISGLYTHRGSHKMVKNKLNRKFKELQRTNVSLSVKYENERLKPQYNKIQRVKSAHHHRARNLGYRAVTAYLRRHNFFINHKRVLIIMKANDLLSTAYNRKFCKYNSYKGSIGKITLLIVILKRIILIEN